MWKKREDKKEEIVVKEVSLLEELCGDDTILYGFLRAYLCLDPLAAIPTKELDVLIEEGEASGDFRPAVDKAIFEESQNPGEKEKYVKVIQTLASKTVTVSELEKTQAEKKGLTDWAISLGNKIKNQKFLSERAEDIINVAAKFYGERLLQLEENGRREKRKEEREEATGEYWRKRQQESAGREVRKKERSKMGRKEKKEAEKQEKIKVLAIEERKTARAKEVSDNEIEETRIHTQEEAGRETRKKERMGN